MASETSHGKFVLKVVSSLNCGALLYVCLRDRFYLFVPLFFSIFLSQTFVCHYPLYACCQILSVVYSTAGICVVVFRAFICI